MKLAAMRYKNYTWPHNPRVYTISYQRTMGAHKVPFGRYCLQDLGPAQRVMKGEGEFVGEGAYEEFKRLATVFYSSGPGLLVHPVWQSANAYFVDLSLRQEPRADYVRYTFTFWEGYDGQSTTLKEQKKETAAAAGGMAANSAEKEQGVWHTVARGDSLWALARQYGVSLADLITHNPQIKNPNLIYVGQKVRVK